MDPEDNTVQRQPAMIERKAAFINTSKYFNSLSKIKIFISKITSSKYLIFSFKYITYKQEPKCPQVSPRPDYEIFGFTQGSKEDHIGQTYS